MRRKPARFRRVAKWGGVALCVLILAALGFSLRFGAGLRISRTFSIWIFDGEVLFFGAEQRPLSPNKSWAVIDTELWETASLAWLFQIPEIHSESVFVPLWIPFLMISVPTGMLIYRDRRRIPPGHCAACG